MVVNGGSLYGGEHVVEGGDVKPGPIAFKDGEITGKIYRYVVWRNDKSCPESDRRRPLPRPPGLQADRRRGEARQPAKRDRANATTSKCSRPSSTPNSRRKHPPSGGGAAVAAALGRERATSVTAQQFFLTDTPCSASGHDGPPGNRRRPPAPQHARHLRQRATDRSTTVGAPDALLLGAPPDPDPEDEDNPPLYDYSNDSYLEPTPDTDKGVQILRDDTSGCHYEHTDRGRSTPSPRSTVG